jgi:hypothetical protein
MTLNKKKIYLRMIGGLGNQLFSYSYARSLAEETGRKLVLDMITGFTNNLYKLQMRLKVFLLKYYEVSAFVYLEPVNSN